MDFRLPDLGEGIDSATVTAVMVKPGDSVSAGQNVIGIETDKAAIEVPCDSAGTVQQVQVKPGDKIPPGAVILTLAEGAKSEKGQQEPSKKGETEAAEKAQPEQDTEAEPEGKEAQPEPAAPARGERQPAEK